MRFATDEVVTKLSSRCHPCHFAAAKHDDDEPAAEEIGERIALPNGCDKLSEKDRADGNGCPHHPLGECGECGAKRKHLLRTVTFGESLRNYHIHHTCRERVPPGVRRGSHRAPVAQGLARDSRGAARAFWVACGECGSIRKYLLRIVLLEEACETPTTTTPAERESHRGSDGEPPGPRWCGEWCGVR